MVTETTVSRDRQQWATIGIDDEDERLRCRLEVFDRALEAFRKGGRVSGLGCDEALRLYADSAEFHVACIEGHLIKSLVSTFVGAASSRLEAPDGLLASSRTTRDAALVSLARSVVVRLDRAAAELRLQETMLSSGEGER